MIDYLALVTDDLRHRMTRIVTKSGDPRRAVHVIPYRDGPRMSEAREQASGRSVRMSRPWAQYRRRRATQQIQEEREYTTHMHTGTHEHTFIRRLKVRSMKRRQ